MFVLIFIIIVYILIYLFFNEKEEPKNENMHNPRHMRRFYPRYLNRPIEYDYIFNDYPYWYNENTPFPWHNPTKFRNLYYPYARIAYY
jgi:hypothetical protein